MISFLVVWIIASLVFVYVGPHLFWGSSLEFSVPLAFMAGAVVAFIFAVAQQGRRIKELEARIKQLESSTSPSDEGAVSEAD